MIAAPVSTIEAHKPVRNGRAHAHDWAADVGRQDVVAFATAVIDLWNLLHCSVCGHLLARRERARGRGVAQEGCTRYGRRERR